VAEVTFNGLTLLSAPGRVMTPRPASERLVAEAQRRLSKNPHARIADVGTGSGAIAIAIAVACPGAEIWATDTNANAVRLARANVRRYHLEDRVFVRQGDLLDPVPAPLDLIVANLPYVPAISASKHPDLRIEPADAVFAAGDGRGPYRRLVEAARCYLTADGALLLQLDRDVLGASRAGLPALRMSLDNSRSALAKSFGQVSAHAG
jgi:release factor glutamine methyltransferase